ncbi:hypothetical protein HK099_005710 [Clydaea vesicula]|uniref:Uncharacterized protein n=1 Tax=Clydaea vesicula TaxID=447962 RepID=A0AAD5XUR2_9FUNG|nr:hypothetical protein HK099_005710 [Clydaea vesicula]
MQDPLSFYKDVIYKSFSPEKTNTMNQLMKRRIKFSVFYDRTHRPGGKERWRRLNSAGKTTGNLSVNKKKKSQNNNAFGRPEKKTTVCCNHTEGFKNIELWSKISDSLMLYSSVPYEKALKQKQIFLTLSFQKAFQLLAEEFSEGKFTPLLTPIKNCLAYGKACGIFFGKNLSTKHRFLKFIKKVARAFKPTSNWLR